MESLGSYLNFISYICTRREDELHYTCVDCGVEHCIWITTLPEGPVWDYLLFCPDDPTPTHRRHMLVWKDGRFRFMTITQELDSVDVEQATDDEEEEEEI